MDSTRSAGTAVTGGSPPRRSRRGALVASAAAVALLLAGGTFGYFHTNVLAPERVCHGWVTPDEAAEALGGGMGRISATEDSGTACTIRLQSWLGGEKRLSLRSVGEETGFPFRKDDWQVSGSRHLLTGGTQGAYDEYGGWALLPSACRNASGDAGGTPVVRAAITGEGSPGDADGLGGLLASAARSLSTAEDCGASGPTGGETRHTAPSPVRQADLDEVCGIDGFRLPNAQGPDGQSVEQRTSGSLAPGHTLFCDLSFDGDEEGAFARLAVVGDAALVPTLEGRGFERARCGGKETVLAFDLRQSDDGQRAVTGLPDTAEFAESFGDAVRSALACTAQAAGAEGGGSR
ncbi:hypothetical protein ACVV2G_30100 [Streptomyces ziwulingensis]